MITREQMNIVVVGHVDHGKSTVIGRLLSDTDSLPKGKLDHVKAICEKNARPFEYAFLLDALKDEQAQGITIDTARCFFKTNKRDYIIIDAPGHVEFLKNMVSGAARAEAALLVIDAQEGIRENSRRHGYLISMLGIPQIVVLVNKMDLVGYNVNIFETITAEYGAFLGNLGVSSVKFIPVSARQGDNLAFRTEKMTWYSGSTVLEHIDAFTKRDDDHKKPFRMPVQDVYKFTAEGDDRRIIAGTIETGQVAVGEKVTFMPSGKKSTVISVEGFNIAQRKVMSSGYATGFTLKDELFVQRGEVMCCSSQRLPHIGTTFKANIFWMGHNPMVMGKKYKLKIAAARVTVRLIKVLSSIDAIELTSVQGKKQIERHDVAECILETTRPVAFDLIDDIQAMGRFVIVDGYDIAGGGIITNAQNNNDSIISMRDYFKNIDWETGIVTEEERQMIFTHKAKFVVITGGLQCRSIAKLLEKYLVQSKIPAYYLGLLNYENSGDAEAIGIQEKWEEQINKLCEIARILTDAGVLFITALNDNDLKIMSRFTEPEEFVQISINCCIQSNGDGNFILDGTLPEEELKNGIIDILKELKILQRTI